MKVEVIIKVNGARKISCDEGSIRKPYNNGFNGVDTNEGGFRWEYMISSLCI